MHRTFIENAFMKLATASDEPLKGFCCVVSKEMICEVTKKTSEIGKK